MGFRTTKKNIVRIQSAILMGYDVPMTPYEWDFILQWEHSKERIPSINKKG